MSRDLIPRTLLFLLCSVGFLPPLARAIWLDLPSVDMKCLSEEIPINILVVGDYTVVHDDWDHDLPTISAKVTSPFGNNLHYQKNVKSGQFAFTTPVAGNYLACFWVDGHNKGITSSVNLEWKIGISARDWLSVARREKIEGVELELRKLEGAVEAIHENLLYLKNREAEMRTVNELTNSRVALFSIMSLGKISEQRYDRYLAFSCGNGRMCVIVHIACMRRFYRRSYSCKHSSKNLLS
ncbi:transmembrane emp24 domain-containing protein p24delta3-like isoform X2 [Magnolia sinica]|uniref:transmembrane emp24 domain-containing protein p24delta3-like isoform X2 n=1 Tax=Magnolia sinica TaxID=86752 RepID=UPI00265A1A64|nr:transmembrane emp24 domain-containing protein p24delta3-like isoform X2 [Magnolia sinica]